MVAYVHKLTLFSRSPSPPLTPRPHMSPKELNPKRPRKWVVLMGLSEASPMNTHTHTHCLRCFCALLDGKHNETERSILKHNEAHIIWTHVFSHFLCFVIRKLNDGRCYGMIVTSFEMSAQGSGAKLHLWSSRKAERYGVLKYRRMQDFIHFY